MRKQDKYSSYAHLLEEETEGTDFTIHSLNRSDSGVIIIAPHGGKIEPGTDVIAREVAKNEFSFYTFNGIKTSNDRDLHITSHNFNEPKCLDLLRRHATVIAVHGCTGEGDAAFLEGRDQAIKKIIHDELNQIGIKSFLDGHDYSGEDLRNICNRGTTGAGVQIELTISLRTTNKADLVVNAVRNAISRIIK